MEKVTKSVFLKEFLINEDEFNATGLDWNELKELFVQYTALQAGLEQAGQFVAQTLQQVASVHSYKVRVKDPKHLIQKIVRKKKEYPEREYSLENYQSQVTDLVGVRALHLFKNEWKAIHGFVLKTWDLFEDPIAYYREGDSPALLEQFKEAGLSVQKHNDGYRSLHYVLNTRPTKVQRTVELQVRTIFEEGWSEIDHRVRYPNLSNDESLREFLQLFNRLAGSADEMGTFVAVLSAKLFVHANQLAEAQSNITKLEQELKETIANLKLSKNNETKLEKKVQELRDAAAPLAPNPFLGVSLSGLQSGLKTTDVFGSRKLLGEGITLANAQTPTGFSSGLRGITDGLSSARTTKCNSCGRQLSPQSLATIGSDGGICPDCKT